MSLLLLLAPAALAADDPAHEGDPLHSRPGDFSFKLEPGVAIPLSAPQSNRFDVGGGETLKALWLLNRYVDLGPSVTFIGLPTAAGHSLGTAWNFGASIGFKRPHDLPDNASFYGISPWIDADALIVSTDDLGRPGFDIGAGVAVPIGRARIFWVGPFVRYLQIIQVDQNGDDNRDAKILSVGLSLEASFGVRRAVHATEPPPVVHAEIFVCPDRDRDGVPDSVDRCPDTPGPVENYGCPVYPRLVLKPDRLELKEKIQFAWNQAILEQASFPVLDEVVQALKDSPGLRVEVEGNTSSEGTDEHNQALSEGRARAVLDYLVAHGIDRGRLGSKGFGSSVPIDTNATSAGRENNRRVEFVVRFHIVPTGAAQ